MITKNWDKARIAVEITYPGGSHTCELPNRASINTKFNYIPYHGLNRWNQGVIEKAPEFTFTIGIPSVSKTVRLLRSLMVSGTPFGIGLSDEIADNNEFALISEELQECRLTNKGLTVIVADMPMVIFQGMALRYTYSDPLGSGSSQDGSGNKVLFGDGKLIGSTDHIFAEWRTTT